MNVRLRRLQSDYEQIQKRFRNSVHIVVRKAAGTPPERYEIEYRVKGLMLQENGQIVESGPHVAEITLTRAYPHRAPHCKMLTPIFHPNIDPGAICIGDHWAASESLSDLIVRIGQMVAYQTYNTKSPLNGEAARWADEHRDLLPVDPTDIIPPEEEAAPIAMDTKAKEAAPLQIAGCANCGARPQG
jgi:ubiquitin-protein ligase